MSTYKTDILLYSAEIDLGDTLRVTCPRCNGDNNTLTITKSEEGVVWNCFRATCSEKGASGQFAHNNKVAVPKPAKKRRKFEGQVVPLSEEHLDIINNLWGITDPPYWYWTNDFGGRVAMSIRSPKYVHRGWVMRDIHNRAAVKALTYVDENEEGISWYRNHLSAPLVVVEDIPSAARASLYVNAVALCGTGISPERAQEIAQYATGPVVMALDQDAIALSFKWAKKYALLWGDVKVLPLNKDIKDMNEDEVQCLLKSL